MFVNPTGILRLATSRQKGTLSDIVANLAVLVKNKNKTLLFDVHNNK